MNVKHHAQHLSLTTGTVYPDGLLPVFISSNLEYWLKGEDPVEEAHSWRLLLDPAHWCGDPLVMAESVLHRSWIELRNQPRLR